jgi:hypothetical protein
MIYLIFEDRQKANTKQAKNPKIKAEKGRIAVHATSKETLLAVAVAESQIRDATTRSTSSSREEA